jgi:hypothetical protein
LTLLPNSSLPSPCPSTPNPIILSNNG